MIRSVLAPGSGHCSSAIHHARDQVAHHIEGNLAPLVLQSCRQPRKGSEEGPPLPYAKGRAGPELFGVKHCKKCGTTWNRDVNAARNIGRVFLWSRTQGGSRPPGLGRAVADGAGGSGSVEAVEAAPTQLLE